MGHGRRILEHRTAGCRPTPAPLAAPTPTRVSTAARVAAGYAPPADPAFRAAEAPLDGLVARDGGPLPVYLALGNHDVGWGGRPCAVPGLADDEASRRRACLEVAHRSAVWSMPGRHYVVDRGQIRLVVLDTNVVGGRAAAFLAGHVHALEHLAVGRLDVLVSGSTAMGSFGRFRWRAPASARALFATSAWGFAILEADREGWQVRFQDFRGEPLHCCAARGDGPCEPVECR